MLPQFVKDNAKGLEMALFINCLNYQVIDVALDILIQEIAEYGSHRPFISCPDILESEGHNFIAIHTLRGRLVS